MQYKNMGTKISLQAKKYCTSTTKLVSTKKYYNSTKKGLKRTHEKHKYYNVFVIVRNHYS